MHLAYRKTHSRWVYSGRARRRKTDSRQVYSAWIILCRAGALMYNPPPCAAVIFAVYTHSRWVYIPGEMPERPNGVVLKTTDLHGSGGSNPSPSATLFPNTRGRIETTPIRIVYRIVYSDPRPAPLPPRRFAERSSSDTLPFPRIAE